jgi:hypothetical protein
VNERAILLEMTDAATQFSAHVKTHERRGGPRQSALSRRSGRRGSRDGCHDGRPRDIEKYFLFGSVDHLRLMTAAM